jgi:hypothetical protein
VGAELHRERPGHVITSSDGSGDRGVARGAGGARRLAILRKWRGIMLHCTQKCKDAPPSRHRIGKY